LVSFGAGVARRSVLVVGHGPRGLVVGAQANGDLCQTVAFAREVAARGYHVATFDWGSDYTSAMASATRVLQSAGAQRIVVGGFSRGAVVGLGAAPRLGPRVVGVLSISGGPSASEGYPTIASVSAYRGPLLLVAARDDLVFPRGTSQRIAAHHTGDESVLLVPGSDHALALLDGDQASVVRRAIFGFLARVTAP